MPGGPVSGVYPPYPGQPGQMSQPGWGAYPGMVPPQPVQKGPSKLIRPMPLWAFIISIVVVAVVLAVLFFFTGSNQTIDGKIGSPDWAAGAQFAGIVALVVGALILIAFGVRAGLGMLAQTNEHRRSQIISALLLALLLFVFGGISVGAQSGIHTMQAHFLEGQQKWQDAIIEYKDGGQAAPTSHDIARTYDEWGEQLSGQQQYQSAIDQFSTVISTYTQATAEVSRAETDAISAYLGWGNQASQQKDYASATQHYDALLNATYCDTTCQTHTSSLDATAYYNLAEQQLSKQAYSTAVSAFSQLTTHFGNSPEAQRAHGDYAKALWGEGQQQLSGTCSTAVSTYQQLSSQFSDTPEGQQAATALKQPQPVTGHFTSNIPGGSEVPAVGLVQGVTANTPSTQFYAILAKSPVQLVKKDGTFKFPSVKQGSYDMVWGTINTSTGAEVFFVGQRYPATVGPLCPFDFGDINESFPLA
jgi:TolA-binding protein